MPILRTLDGIELWSFVTVEDATALLYGRLNTEPWHKANTPEALFTLGERRTAALVQATRLIETQITWATELDENAIPEDVQLATALYALALLRDTSEAPGQSGSQTLKSKKIGDLTLTFQDMAGTITQHPQGIPEEVRLLLKPYGTLVGRMMIPLLRT